MKSSLAQRARALHTAHSPASHQRRTRRTNGTQEEHATLRSDRVERNQLTKTHTSAFQASQCALVEGIRIAQTSSYTRTAPTLTHTYTLSRFSRQVEGHTVVLRLQNAQRKNNPIVVRRSVPLSTSGTQPTPQYRTPTLLQSPRQRGARGRGKPPNTARTCRRARAGAREITPRTQTSSESGWKALSVPPHTTHPHLQMYHKLRATVLSTARNENPLVQCTRGVPPHTPRLGSQVHRRIT